MSNSRSLHRRFKSSGIGQLFTPNLQSAILRQHPKKKKKKGKDKYRTHRIFILGGSESGKTTICKQLDFIVNGIPDSAFIEQQYWSRDILLSVVSGLENLVQVAKQRGVEVDPGSGLDDKTDQRLHLFKKQIARGEMSRRDYEQALTLFRSIWSDVNLRQMVAERELGAEHHFPLHKGLSYLCDEKNLERICHEYYLPTVPDYIKSYSRTSSVVNHELQMEDMKIDLVDVGGHASQRNKWKKLYADDVEELYQVWFVADMSSFNEYVETSETDHDGHSNNPMTRLQESLELFDSIVKRFLIQEEKALILVLTMYDRFVRKIKNLNLNMADFGFENEFDRRMASNVDYCTRFIINQFMKRVKRLQKGSTASLSEATAQDQQEKKIHICIINPQDRKTVVALCDAIAELKSVHHMNNRCINAVRQVQKEIATGVRPEMGSFVLGLGGSFGSFRQISKDDSDLPSPFSVISKRPRRLSNTSISISASPLPPHLGRRSSANHHLPGDSLISRSPSGRSPVQNFIPTGSFRASFTSMNRNDSVAIDLDDIVDKTVREILSDDEDEEEDKEKEDDNDKQAKGKISPIQRPCKLQSDVMQFALEVFDEGLDNQVTDGVSMNRSASLESCTTTGSNSSTGSIGNGSSNNSSSSSSVENGNRYRSNRRPTSTRKSLAKSLRNIFASRPEDDQEEVYKRPPRRTQGVPVSPTA